VLRTMWRVTLILVALGRIMGGAHALELPIRDQPRSSVRRRLAGFKKGESSSHSTAARSAAGRPCAGRRHPCGPAGDRWPVKCAGSISPVCGSLGEGVAERHHCVALASLKESHRTKLSELAIVCSNSH
jgi:hypothetical protein